MDPNTEDGALRLKSFVYADTLAEFQQLEEAIEVCRRVRAEIDRANGGDWLPEQLAQRRAGVATVVCHSLLIASHTPLRAALRQRLLRSHFWPARVSITGTPMAASSSRGRSEVAKSRCCRARDRCSSRAESEQAAKRGSLFPPSAAAARCATLTTWRH